jgi:hypothetical protein
MFSYQNKVVGIKIRNPISDLYDVFINNAYVGSTTGRSDGVDLIGSNNTSLNFPQPSSGETLAPDLIIYSFDDFRYYSYNEDSSFPGYYILGSDTHLLIYNNEGDNNQWEFRTIDDLLIATGGSDLSNPFGYYLASVGDLDLTVYTPRPEQVSWYYEGEFSTGSGISNNISIDASTYGIYEIVSGTEAFELVDLYSEDGWAIQFGSQTTLSSINIFENPYGVYTGDFGFNGDSYYTLTVSPVGGGSEADIPTYHFSNLLLNTGLNELCFDNKSIDAGTNTISYEINLYDISGSTLVDPFEIVTDEVNLPSGGDGCVSFYLQYPTGSGIETFEFDPVFDVDTGNLNQIFTGSGIHLQKDVTFFFDILDQQLNTISSNQQFLENPLISGCVFDVLNIDGTTAVENFFTGKYSRSLTITESDNENIFGAYQKDFGVRCKLPNTFDGSIFTGIFFAYGNVPHILDIAPNYTEFSGARQVTESLDAAIVLQNDLKFTQMDRYDIYASTGNQSAVNELTFLNPTAQEGYLLSQSATNVSNTYTLTINKGELEQNTPYYFTVVPYGTLGSGEPFVFGPTTFIPKPADLTFPQIDASGLNIHDGISFSRTEYKTGRFTGSESILHEFSSGDFSSVKYFVEIYGDGIRQLSELKGVVNDTGFHLTKEIVNDTSTDYQLVDLLTGQQCGLYASGTGYAGYTYKLQATML